MFQRFAVAVTFFSFFRTDPCVDVEVMDDAEVERRCGGGTTMWIGSLSFFRRCGGGTDDDALMSLPFCAENSAGSRRRVYGF